MKENRMERVYAVLRTLIALVLTASMLVSTVAAVPVTALQAAAESQALTEAALPDAGETGETETDSAPVTVTDQAQETPGAAQGEVRPSEGRDGTLTEADSQGQGTEDEGDGFAARLLNNSLAFNACKAELLVRNPDASSRTLTLCRDDFTVTVTYIPSVTGIPAGAELAATEIEDDNDSYRDYITSTAAALGRRTEELSHIRAFDIALRDPETGAEYQPDGSVKVSIALTDEAPHGFGDWLSKALDRLLSGGLAVVHVPADAAGDAQLMPCDRSGNTVEFETDGFSVFVLCAYTVDFHWGEFTYSIKGQSELTLSALLEKLGMTEITLADVQAVSFSNPEYVKIEQTGSDWLLRSLAPFDTVERLTLELNNGQSLEIKVTDEDVEFTAPTAVEGLVYAGKEQALITAGTVEDDTGTLCYAIGANAEIAPADNTGETINWSTDVPTAADAGTYYVWYKVVGDENHSSTEAQCLTVTISPAAYNPKVVSVTAGDYDAEHNTITYTVVVKVEGNSCYNGVDYPATIRSTSSGLAFQSGSYTYAHKEGFTLPDGANQSRVNDADVSVNAATAFDSLPLTVANMYDGDTITLTYTAEVVNANYAGSGHAEAENSISCSISENPNISTSTEDDTDAVTTTIPYTPLTREFVALDGSWAYWRVTVNPRSYTLNGGSRLTLKDTFDDKVAMDAGQSIDYSSVHITGAGNVTYDYSGSTGTFMIPDNTSVAITYRTRITAQPGEAVLFRGTAVLQNANGDTIASATAGVTQETVVIYPSPSDVTGSGNFMVKLKVYADGEMQQGIEGAQFILLDANQRPLEYKSGGNKDDPVTFTTGSDGYASIELHEEEGDVSIEKNTTYYLEMMQAVAGYQKDNTLYKFAIKDEPDYSNYEYHNGDTLKVRLYPATPGLSVSIRFSGSYALQEEQQNDVTAVLQMLDDENNWVEVERHPYSDSQWGSIKFDENLYDEGLGLYQNTYRVVVENEKPWNLPDGVQVKTTYYCMINDAGSDPYTEPQEFFVSSAKDSVSVVIDNRYEESQLTIVKMNKQTGETLSGAEFSVYKIVNGSKTGEAVKTYTTDTDGELVIRGGDPFESETLYGIKETNAPTGYLLPKTEEWQYFYFCNDDYLEPSILANLPEDAEAINLTESGDRITIDNQKAEITIPVMKLWQGNVWPANTEVVVGLYQSVEGVVDEEGNPVVEQVKDNGTPRTVTLTSSMPYNNRAFTDLPSRDDENRSITYSIKEESINGQTPLEAGYVPEYGVSSAGVYIVRNKPSATLTVSKEWYDLNGQRVTAETVLAQQSSVTFDVYRSASPFTDSNPDDGVTNADMAAFVSGLVKVREGLSFGASDDWSISINDLDLQDDLGNRYYYYVMEMVPSFGNELYVIDAETGTVTIRNKIAPVSVPLTVTKAALVDDPRPESLERDFAFTLKLKNDRYPIRSWPVYTDTENPDNSLITDENGEVTFTLKPTKPASQPTEGASITLNLPTGVTATVTESYLSEYTVAARSAEVSGTTGDNGRTFAYETSSETGAVTLTYTNTLRVICKVVEDDGPAVPFESLSRALQYIRDNPDKFTTPWKIYLLEDYTIPSTDVISVGAEESLTIQTASTDATDGFPFKAGQEETDRAVITRGGAGGSMLENAGTLTLENICLDGGSITAAGDGGLVHSTGTLNLNDKTTLRDSAAGGRGGAVYAEGTVNIVDGVSITGNSAPSASALYLRGTLNMTGGSIIDNTGASDGAVVTANARDVINLSGNSVIFDNTNTQNKAANLYIGVDSDSIVNVVAPGLGTEAHIGITAMEGHMLIGEQFATAEIHQTENLSRFYNDTYGYHGKLKEGTSTNIVWDGLTLTIRKVVDPDGANSNDRFTITIASTAILMNSYIIDGITPDYYTVTAARANRPGRIVLRNVKAEDVITISPMPVGDYTITETASDYAPSYTLTETGSGASPETIEGGVFYAADDSTVTVTNTRRLADVKLTKTLTDRLKGEDETQDFYFKVKLTEADGTAVSGFALSDEITTNASGEATFTMSPSNHGSAVLEGLKAPVGATMTITETDNLNYTITASALTMPAEGEGEPIADTDTDNANIFSFPVTDDGAAVTFSNERKFASIELRKELTGKVSATETFDFTVTLTRADGTRAANYTMYIDSEDPANDIATDEDGKATISFVFGPDESSKNVTLSIPEGTKLEVEETEVKKDVGGSQQKIYDTAYSINGAAATTGTKATIDSVSDSDSSIVFTNARKMRTITVKNTVSGYSGNVVPFTYTATVTDGNPKDYDENGFTDGVMTFELTTGQSRTLTVPYGATLNVTQTFLVGYKTTIKHGNNNLGTKLEDAFTVTENVNVEFSNAQLIGLRLVNETSSTLNNVTVTVGYGTEIYRVNEDQTDQEKINTGSQKTATLSIEPGKTAILEIQHDTSVTAEQNYTVSGSTPAAGYYYTINNEPSFHEYADPAILRVYDQGSFQVKGKLRYSVQDSIVTFTEQPLVSFDSNGGVWTTEMEGYRDRDGDRKVYQMAVDNGKKVAKPSPDPVYQGIEFLGWTTDGAFAKQAHTAGDDVSGKLYDFDSAVTAPITLYAIWAHDSSVRTVTVKNGLNTSLTVDLTLTSSGRIGNIPITDTVTTDRSGNARITLGVGKAVNLSIPDGVKLVLTGSDGTAYSADFTDADSVASSYTIDSVKKDGTVSFIGGICKITDSEGNILYDNTGNPAVYPTLQAAFTAYVGTLYTDASHTTAAVHGAVKLLVDEYEISSNHTFPTATMTLTTAGKDDADFPYVGVRDRATIYRSTAGAGENCFTLSTGGNITLTDIVLDGGSEQGVKIAKAKNGGLIFMSNASGILNIETGTTLRNCEFAAYDDGNNSRGGAIYMTNGTLNVSAGLFSNLHAYQGGAICVTGGTLNVTGSSGSTQFENCYSERQDGGAIYYKVSKDLVIDGGDDKDNPGIIFTGCAARYTSGTIDGGDGGAIFATNTEYSNSVTVKGCAFIECSAKSGNSASTSGFGGGAINGYKVKGLTVSDCSFEACDSLCGGGAVATSVKYTETVENETVTIQNCSFDQCNCKAQGGALAVYQDDNGKTNSATKLSIINSSFKDCSSGTNNGSGGAIQCYLPCMVFTGSSFTDCWAGKEGGAVNNFYGSNYQAVWAKSFMSVDNCRFIRCRAEDRYDTGAVQHYGGGINAKVKIVSVTGSYFEDCVSTLREGGALHIGGQGSGSKATVTGSTFKNCTAKNGGGALLSSHETLEISNCNFYGCGSSASNGGAVYHTRNSRADSTQNTTTITDSTFGVDPNETDGTGCSAAGNGGAIWTRAGMVSVTSCTISGCSANNGGAVYLSKDKVSSQSGTITDGTITGCEAVQGSAVYVGNSVTFSGELSVTGNTVSDNNDGAIHGGTLYFEGNVKVQDNTCSADPAFDHDVLMQNDNLTTIQTTAVGLGNSANIGVYVPDQNNRYTKYGLEGQKFGTHKDGNGNAYLESFFNDRDDGLFGYQEGTDGKIYWGRYLCKITDAEGNTLKRPNGRDAVYQRLTLALGEFTKVTGGEPVYIKMLVEEYHIQQDATITNFPAKDITLTTAGKDDTQHPYRGNEGTVCTISRDTRYSSSNQLFKLSNDDTTFQLENITLDGRKNKTSAQGDYRLIEVSEGHLVVNGGTTFQYGRANDNGGAICISGDTGTSLEINSTEGENVYFEHCTQNQAYKNGGGAIYAVCAVTITSDGKGKTYFSDCSARSGGAIMVNYSGSKAGDLVIDRAEFTDCYALNEGGAVYQNNNNLGIQTIVKNSRFVNCYNTNTSPQYAQGGALATKAETLTVDTCQFTDCYAVANGGAINHGSGVDNRVKTELIDTTFVGCYIDETSNNYGYGGSVYTQAKEVQISGSSFTNSTSTNHGGALYCQSSHNDSNATIFGTTFDNCSTTRTDNGSGGAIYSRNKTLTLEETAITACTAPGYSGAVYMDTDNSTLNITDGTVISSCYANQGGAIYLKNTVTLNLTGSPEFTQNGYTTKTGSVVDTEEGACIYLAEGGRINLQDSPKFSRNILPDESRITNGGILDNVRQDIYLAGYSGKSAASIYVVGELTGDTIWVWPEKEPHRMPNDQFAKIGDEVALSEDELADTLSHLRNALADSVTNCSDGEYLAGVKVGADNENIYWDKMYTISFKKIDNKAVTVPDAEFTLYKDLACTVPVTAAVSADGDNDTDAQGKILARGTVEFTSVRIGAYYMKETRVPTSFKDNEATYLVLVGTPYLKKGEASRYLWEGNGPLNVEGAENRVAQHTTNAGKYYGVFLLDENNKAVLSANLASSSVGVVNIRNDYQVSFMKKDGNGKDLPGAAFTIYTAILDEDRHELTYDDGYPKLMRWSRDGENYPAPVVSADGTSAYRDVNNNTLPKGMVYFRELPLGTYYLLETTYPERNGDGRRTFYAETDRVFRLEIRDEGTAENPKVVVTLSEGAKNDEGNYTYTELGKDSEGRYFVRNQEVVCKLTDGNDNLLYVKGHTVYETKSDEGTELLFPVVYTTLKEGFDAAQNGSFVNGNGKEVTLNELKLKVLKDCELSEPVTYQSNRRITFMTAETRAGKDKYIFSTTRTSDTSRALITCDYSRDGSASAITLTNGASMTLQTIRLNGQQRSRAIHVTSDDTSAGTLTVSTNARIENFSTTGSGGAILLDDGTNLTINGGYNRTAVFSANQAAEGGAIAVGKDCTVNIQNAQFQSNAASSNGGAVCFTGTGDGETGGGETAEIKNAEIKNAVFKNNRAGSGGAIYAAKDSRITLIGGTINGNTSTGDGAGIYLSEDSTLYLSGDPNFGGTGLNAKGNITATNGNFKGGSLTNATNGGQVYKKARQDIYIAGYTGDDSATNAASLVINGAITSGDGAIWVWAAENPHYKVQRQFAKYTDDIPEKALDQTLKAFRNGRPDSETGGIGGVYLYGIRKEDDTDRNVFWYGIEGNRMVILRKVSGAYESLQGGEFTIYNGATAIEGTDINGNTTRSFTSGASGVFYIDKMNYGTYFIEETKAPSGYSTGWFYLIVGDDVYLSGQYPTRALAEVAAAEKNAAIKADAATTP